MSSMNFECFDASLIQSRSLLTNVFALEELNNSDSISAHTDCLLPTSTQPATPQSSNSDTLANSTSSLTFLSTSEIIESMTVLHHEISATESLILPSGTSNSFTGINQSTELRNASSSLQRSMMISTPESITDTAGTSMLSSTEFPNASKTLQISASKLSTVISFASTSYYQVSTTTPSIKEVTTAVKPLQSTDKTITDTQAEDRNFIVTAEKDIVELVCIL